jgi:hypothetical protein
MGIGICGGLGAKMRVISERRGEGEEEFVASTGGGEGGEGVHKREYIPFIQQFKGCWECWGMQL